MKIECFKKGDSVPPRILDFYIRNKGILKFGVSCKVITLGCSILVFPLKPLKENDHLMIAKNCVFKESENKIYCFTKPFKEAINVKGVESVEEHRKMVQSK